MGQTKGVVLDAESLAGRTEIPKHVAQLVGGTGAGLVGPDADVLDDRRVPGLPKVGGTGQKRKPPVGAEVEALEEAEAERVIAGEVVHALLIEHQEAVEILPDELARDLVDAGAVLRPVEMQSQCLLLFCFKA